MSKINKDEIKKDLKNASALDAVQHSEGGKLLVKSCLQDIVSSVDTLAIGYSSLTHIELISNCAKLKERLALYKALTNAKKNKKITEEALREALEEDPD